MANETENAFDLNTESKVFQFEKAHACVIYKNPMSAATNKRMPHLYVQAIDQYGYQREWTLQFRHTPGDSKKLFWESHIYMHPGRREIVEVSKAQATACMKRFLFLCEHYPALLFNVAGDNASNPARPQSEGFIHFAEALHRGELPSKKLL